jgi:hypothetical protein
MTRSTSTAGHGRFTVAVWAGLVAALVVRPAIGRAAGPEADLASHVSVEPGVTCLDADALVDDVRTWLGEGTVEPDLSIEVQGSGIDPRAVAFRVLRSGRVIASRRFDPGPARCDHLHAAVGLAIAMALKASLVDEIAPVRAAPPPAPPAMPGADASATRRAPETPWGLGVAPIVGIAVLPDPAAGGAIAIGRSLVQFLSVRLSALALAARNETFDAAPGRFDAALFAGRLDVCAGVDLARPLRVRGCVGLGAGVIRAQGYGFPQSHVAVVPWLAIADDLELEARIDRRWAVEGTVSLILPLGQSTLVVRDLSGTPLAERRLASFGGVLSVGPVLRF